MRALANALSVLLHPLWMPTLSLAVCVLIDPYIRFRYTLEGLYLTGAMVFAMTAVFPLTSALLMRRSGLVSDLTMPHRVERILAYLVTLLYYVMCYYLIRRTTEDQVVLGLFFGAACCLLLVLLITLRWKISAHMAGAGGLIGAVLSVMAADGQRAPWLLCALFVLVGALGTARLITGSHTPAQVYAGAVLGCACVYASVTLGLSI